MKKEQKTSYNFLQKVVRVRKYLMRTGNSGKPDFRCIKIIEEFEKYMDAYKNLPDDYWKRFIAQRQSEIKFLFPENKTGEAFTKTLNELV